MTMSIREAVETHKSRLTIASTKSAFTSGIRFPRLAECMGEISKFLKSWTLENQNLKLAVWLQNVRNSKIDEQTPFDKLELNQKSYCYLQNSGFWGWLSIPEFSIFRLTFYGKSASKSWYQELSWKLSPMCVGLSLNYRSWIHWIAGLAGLSIVLYVQLCTEESGFTLTRCWFCIAIQRRAHDTWKYPKVSLAFV